MINLRGNKPLLLDKMVYTEHSLAKKLKDSPISEYNPKWTKNNVDNEPVSNKTLKKPPKKNKKLGWENF